MPAFRSGGVPRFIVRRLLLGLLVLILVSIVVFAATPASLAALRHQLHLDRPVLDQYLSWVAGLLHGNFGLSLAAQEPVSTLLGPKLVNSGVLVLIAAVVSIPLSIAIGSWAADRKSTRLNSSH